jgi:hypothetical protein
MTTITSPWALSQTVIQFSEDPSNVAWDDSGNFVYVKSYDKSYIKTVTPMSHIANSFGGDRRQKTNFLYFTNFKFKNIPIEVTGLEAKILMNRGGRITDDTVQLRYKDQWIGKNYAISSLGMINWYGGWTDTWGVDLKALGDIDVNALINDPSFGIGIRYQSHPQYPHFVSPMIEYVSLRPVYSTVPGQGDVGQSGGDGEGLDPGQNNGAGGGGTGGQGKGGPSGGGAGGKKHTNGSGGDSGYGNQNPIPYDLPPSYLGSYAYYGSSAQYVGSSAGYTGTAGYNPADPTNGIAGVQILNRGSYLGYVQTPADLPPDATADPTAHYRYALGSSYFVGSTVSFWYWDYWRWIDSGNKVQPVF